MLTLQKLTSQHYYNQVIWLIAMPTPNNLIIATWRRQCLFLPTDVTPPIKALSVNTSSELLHVDACYRFVDYGGLEVGAVPYSTIFLLVTNYAYFVISLDVRILGPVPGSRRPRPSAAPLSQSLCYGVGCGIWGPHGARLGHWVWHIAQCRYCAGWGLRNVASYRLQT